jgi:hypothetical protein
VLGTIFSMLSGDTPWVSLHGVLEEWTSAVLAVDRETYRLTNGGDPDLATMARLFAAVELARERCEQVLREFQAQLGPQIPPGPGFLKGTPASKK